MKAKTSAGLERSVSVLLIAVNVCGPYLSAAATQSRPSEARPQVATFERTFEIPRLPAPAGRASLVPVFSADPSDEEITRAPLFQLGLVPVGRTTPAENQAFSQALLA